MNDYDEIDEIKELKELIENNINIISEKPECLIIHGSR